MSFTNDTDGLSLKFINYFILGVIVWIIVSCCFTLIIEDVDVVFMCSSSYFILNASLIKTIIFKYMK